MTYCQACALARMSSKDCTQHVVATIKTSTYTEPVIDKEGYSVSDWFDGSVVATFTNGERQ